MEATRKELNDKHTLSKMAIEELALQKVRCLANRDAHLCLQKRADEAEVQATSHAKAVEELKTKEQALAAELSKDKVSHIRHRRFYMGRAGLRVRDDWSWHSNALLARYFPANQRLQVWQSVLVFCG